MRWVKSEEWLADSPGHDVSCPYTEGKLRGGVMEGLTPEGVSYRFRAPE